MRTFKLTCDRCGYWEEREEERVPAVKGRKFWSVAVGIKQGICSVFYSGGTPVSSEPAKGALWCETCCRELRLLQFSHPLPDMEPRPSPGLEDLIREIVREEIESD